MKYKNITIYFALVTSIFYVTSSFANQMTPIPSNSEHKKSSQGTQNIITQEDINTGNTEFNKIVEEFKDYLNTVEPEVRAEIINYRKAVLAINKQKRELYKKLSQEAQGYLSKEQEYKKKLPINQRDIINIQKPGTSYKKLSIGE